MLANGQEIRPLSLYDTSAVEGQHSIYHVLGKALAADRCAHKASDDAGVGVGVTALSDALFDCSEEITAIGKPKQEVECHDESVSEPADTGTCIQLR